MRTLLLLTTLSSYGRAGNFLTYKQERRAALRPWLPGDCDLLRGLLCACAGVSRAYAGAE